MTEVLDVEPASLSHAARVDLLVTLEQQRARIDARQQRVLAAMAADPHPYADPVAALDKQWVREDVACALRISAVTATARLHLATELVHELSRTLSLLERGEISLLHARTLADSVRPLTAEAAQSVESAVLDRAPQQTLAQFRRSLTRAVLRADPRRADQRHTDALAERRVCLRPAEDGMSELWALLPADAGARLWHALSDAAAADRRTGDDRSADQRRADALVNLVCNPDPEPRPQRPGAGPAVQVSVALSTLVGLDDQPAELAGHGPIPPALARRIAADPTGTWRRLVTDPQGRLLDDGRTIYRPPAALADHVSAAEQTCRFPTCSRAARGCEIDHILAWADGGPTDAANLQPLCGRDHHLKHDTGWTPTRRPDGITRWMSPTGHTYDKPPDTHPIDHTTDQPP